jgi:membrane protease YdiL (CAAX protease family)
MSTANGFNHDPFPGDEPILSVVPVEEPLTVRLVERPPHPGFWMSLVWSIVFFLVANGAVVVCFLAIATFDALPSSRLDDYMQSLFEETGSGKATPSSKAYRLLAPATLAAWVISLLFAFLIVRVLVGRDWRRELAVRVPRASHIGLILLGMPAFMILPNLVAELAKTVLPTIDYQKEIEAMIRHWPWMYGLLAIGLGPGIVEELWCRGFLGRGLLARYGLWGGILLTSLFFGVMHVDPPHIVATACMGAAMHYVYVMTRSLLAPMLIHTLNNATSYVLTALAADHPALKGFLDSIKRQTLVGPWTDLSLWELVNMLLLYASSAALLVAVGWALYQSRVRVGYPTDQGLFPEQPPFPGVALPPPQSGATLYSCRPGVLSVLCVFISVLLVVGTVWWAGTADKQPHLKPAPAAHGMLP